MITADLPFAFVATRCELPSETRQAQLTLCRRAGLPADDIDCLQLSPSVPDSEKRCVGAIIRKVRCRIIGRFPLPPTLLFSHPLLCGNPPTSRLSPTLLDHWGSEYFIVFFFGLHHGSIQSPKDPKAFGWFIGERPLLVPPPPVEATFGRMKTTRGASFYLSCLLFPLPHLHN